MDMQVQTSFDPAAEIKERPSPLAPLRPRSAQRRERHDRRLSARPDPRKYGWRRAAQRMLAEPGEEVPLLDPAFDDVDELTIALLGLPPTTLREASAGADPRA